MRDDSLLTVALAKVRFRRLIAIRLNARCGQRKFLTLDRDSLRRRGGWPLEGRWRRFGSGPRCLHDWFYVDRSADFLNRRLRVGVGARCERQGRDARRRSLLLVAR